MSKDFLHNLIILIVLILAQVLICNHIMLFNVAMPFIFIYVIIRLPMSMKTGYLLTWAFLAGFVVDLFSDTLGLNTLACTLLAGIKRPLLYAYIPKDDRTKDIEPTLNSLGVASYCKYLFTAALLYCVLFFSIEFLNFADIKDIIIMSISSSVFSFLLLLGVDSLIVTKREKRL